VRASQDHGVPLGPYDGTTHDGTSKAAAAVARSHGACNRAANHPPGRPAPAAANAARGRSAGPWSP
jgi:hypothetical protein